MGFMELFEEVLSADGFALKIISDSKSGSHDANCKLFRLECNPFFMENLIFIIFRFSLTIIILAGANLFAGFKTSRGTASDRRPPYPSSVDPRLRAFAD